MTPEAFALLVASCGFALPTGITVDRIHAIAGAESGWNPAAVSPPNRDGSRDFGLMQLNAQHIGKPGFPRTPAEALQPCPNLAAGVRILAEADRAALCIYNSGRADCRRASGSNGYPERVRAVAARSAPAPAPAAALAARAEQPERESWDVFAEHAPEPAAEIPEGDDDDAAPSGRTPRVVVELP